MNDRLNEEDTHGPADHRENVSENEIVVYSSDWFESFEYRAPVNRVTG